MLGDYAKLQRDDERVKEITSLGLTYNLLTDYTSFVAIDTVVRNTDGKVETVTQPLPLPQGVSDLRGRWPGDEDGVCALLQAMGAPGGIDGGVAAAAHRCAARCPGAFPMRPVTTDPNAGGGPAIRRRSGVALAGAGGARLAVPRRTASVPASRSALKLCHGHPTLVAVTVSGAASPEEAERVVRVHLAETRACLEKAVRPGGDAGAHTQPCDPTAPWPASGWSRTRREPRPRGAGHRDRRPAFSSSALRVCFVAFARLLPATVPVLLFAADCV